MFCNISYFHISNGRDIEQSEPCFHILLLMRSVFISYSCMKKMIACQSKYGEGGRMEKPMNERIYLSPPHMTGEEFRYLYEAFKSNWIAPLGTNVDGFENDICDLTGAGYAAALASGSAAIFLGLKALGVGSADTVFCSDFTFAGSCFPIKWLGAKPVFIDCQTDTCNMSPDALEAALHCAQIEGSLPKAVIIVDIYGNPADYDRLLPICAAYGVTVLEDAAEALGSRYKGKYCGTFGKIGAFSFNGNKIITTSGGGMALCDDKEPVQKIKFWATQSREPVAYYEHKEVGYNYRLSNICASIGRGQLRGLVEKIKKRGEIKTAYERGLAACPVSFISGSRDSEPNHWLTVLLVNSEVPSAPEKIIQALGKRNIEARLLWKPMHAQPVFSDAQFFSHGGTCVGDDLFKRGVCLPSGDTLTQEQLDTIIGIIKAVFSSCGLRQSAI
jgi:pyridoxal phosphate-dependent aminotransferase EpsN